MDSTTLGRLSLRQSQRILQLDIVSSVRNDVEILGCRVLFRRDGQLRELKVAHSENVRGGNFERLLRLIFTYLLLVTSVHEHSLLQVFWVPSARSQFNGGVIERISFRGDALVFRHNRA